MNVAAIPMVEDILTTYSQKAVNGEMSAKAALDQAAAEVNAKLAK